MGCKLWCCLPPNIDESFLLYNLEDEDKPFEMAAIEWFEQVEGLENQSFNSGSDLSKYRKINHVISCVSTMS